MKLGPGFYKNGTLCVHEIVFWYHYANLTAHDELRPKDSPPLVELGSSPAQ